MVIKLFPTTTRPGVYVITYMATNESLPDMLELSGDEMQDQMTFGKNHNGVLTISNSKKANDPSWDEEQVDEAVEEAENDAPILHDIIKRAMKQGVPVFFFDDEYMVSAEPVIKFERQGEDTYQFTMGATHHHDGRQISYETRYFEKMQATKKSNRLLVTYSD
jgi:hypothetical protein